MAGAAIPFTPGSAPASAPPAAVSGLTVYGVGASACPSRAAGTRRTLDLDCLNRQWQDPSPPSAVDPDAATGDRAVNRLGLFDRAGTAQRMGSNFGRSAFPERPPTIFYPAFGGRPPAQPAPAR